MTVLPLGRLGALGPSTTDVPVVPDAETARRWAFDELADPAYHQGESLLSSFLRWLEGLFTLPEGLGGLTLPGPVALLVIAGVVVLLVVVTLLVIGPVRRSRRAASGAVLDVEDTRGSAELRAAAERAEVATDWDTAVLERFRAIARALEERVVLDERPGRTAHEVALDAAAALPDQLAALTHASDVFDGVCYGGRRATQADAAALRRLDDDIRATRLRRTSADGEADATDDAGSVAAASEPQPVVDEVVR